MQLASIAMTAVISLPASPSFRHLRRAGTSAFPSRARSAARTPFPPVRTRALAFDIPHRVAESAGKIMLEMHQFAHLDFVQYSGEFLAEFLVLFHYQSLILLDFIDGLDNVLFVFGADVTV